MTKIVSVFVAVIAILLLFVFNYDFSTQSIPPATKVSPVKKAPQKTETKNVKIIYKEVKKKQTVKKSQLKDQFRNLANKQIEKFQTLSKTQVGKYTVAIKVPQKIKQNKFSPPQFPTLIKGEIDGKKFTLTLNQEAKNQNIIFTIATKGGPPAVVNLDSLKDTAPGQIVDIGNISPPDEITKENVTDFETATQDTIDNSVQESKNTQDDSIAPPTPPTIGG